MRGLLSSWFARILRLGLVSCLALCAACSAFARNGEVWRCNTSYGHYDEYTSSIRQDTSSITGSINFHRADLGPRWDSIAKIGFEDSTLQDGNCHCNGVFVKAFEAGVSLSMLVDGTVMETFPVGGTFDYPIPFKITIDPNGQMTVQVGKTVVQASTAILAHPRRDTMLMTCSGADVSFLNVSADAGGSGVQSLKRHAFAPANRNEAPSAPPAIPIDDHTIPANTPRSTERCPYAAQEAWSHDDVVKYCWVRK